MASSPSPERWQRTWCSKAAALAERMGLPDGHHAFASGLVVKFVVFLSVWAFFFWSMPKWQFPKIYCATLIGICNK